MDLTFKQIKHNSKQYWDLVKLRDAILRKPLNLEFTKEQLLAEDNQFHFGGYLNDQLVATFIFAISENQSLKMRQVAVASNFQKKGIGQEMNGFAEFWAKSNNYKSINCNARAVAAPFYTKCGYKIISEIFQEVNIDHYKMQKVL